ncbi:MAG: SOS response-associated peptidase [Burkholderiaceae bacterium]|nr:SOS response-associated peptidase [Burkholderiaceae bacterium]MCD8516150.1 SOS response-associated peptidase [Burkholderiaceae bacterium]MCD8566157.1 SOS response-associated peptidase [Burkholderiaceae bacterium]
MCAVYSPTFRQDWVKDTFGLALPPAAAEVYPGHMGPIVVRSHRNGRTAIGMAQFGLVPPWAKDTKISRHTYNARLETAANKPSYRDAWRQAHWAIILADCFYEPCYETGKAVRWLIEQESGEPMGIAGLWQRWHDRATNQILASFTMLTVNADGHPILSRMHKPEDEKRTPVVLSPAVFDQWLTCQPENAGDYLQLQNMPPLAAAPAGGGGATLDRPFV